MARFSRTLTATVLFMWVVEIYSWPCHLMMRRDIDGKRHAYPTRYQCLCGRIRYDPGSKLCCRGNLYPKHYGHLCCGAGTYNRFSQGCCGQRIYDPSSQVCCSGTIYAKPCQCCEGVPYYPSSQACCEGKLSTRAGITSPACCGKTVYDSGRKICCHGYVSNKPVNAKCCGTQAYNQAQQKCCRYGTAMIPISGRFCPVR